MIVSPIQPKYEPKAPYTDKIRELMITKEKKITGPRQITKMRFPVATFLASQNDAQKVPKNIMIPNKVFKASIF